MQIQDFNSSLPMMLYRALDVLMPRFRAIFREFGLTEQQWRILRVLWEHEELSFRDLARDTLIPPPSLVGIIDRLEKRSLVARRKDTDDRRGVFVRVSSDGRKLKEDVTPHVDAAYHAIEQSVDPDVWKQLINGLDRIWPNNDERGNSPVAVNEYGVAPMSDLAYHNVDGKKAEAPSGCPVDHAFSPYADRYIANPYAWLAEKREKEPLFYSEDLGYVVLTRMEDVEQVFRNPEIFSSENVQDPVFPICKEAAEILEAKDYNPVAVMSNRQQPDHTRIRKHTQAGFSPRRIKFLEPIVRQRAETLIDNMLAGDSPAEWVSAVGNPLPAETIFRLIGFDEADDEQLKEWTNDRLEFTWGKSDKDYQIKVAKNLLAYWRYVAAYVDMRKDNPADDFTSELLAAHNESPEEISFREVQSVVYGLSFAGHEIVRNLISNALLCLLGERENWERLCADPKLIKPALEEVLRFNSAQTSWRRITNCETELHGVTLPKGTPVFMSLASANNDPRLFEKPEHYDMDRKNASKHIAFGRGPHLCLGRLLAKLEVQIVLETLIGKVPSLRLVIGQDLRYAPNFSFRGPKSLYMAWDR